MSYWERQRKLFHMVFWHNSKRSYHNGQSWTRLKLGARSCFQVSPCVYRGSRPWAILWCLSRQLSGSRIRNETVGIQTGTHIKWQWCRWKTSLLCHHAGLNDFAFESVRNFACISFERKKTKTKHRTICILYSLVISLFSALSAWWWKEHYKNETYKVGAWTSSLKH